MSVRGRVLHPGAAAGTSTVLTAPLSFWGGFDPLTGEIIDRAHPQVGESLAGRVVAMPGSRGSAGTPGALAEAIRRHTGPTALLLTKADANITIGAMVASTLYDRHCPVVLLDEASFGAIARGVEVRVDTDGRVEW